MTRQPTVTERRPWKLSAACAAVDPETWYDPAQVTAAKRVCLFCPVRRNCLTFALDTAEPWGVWGGLSQTDRRRLAAGGTVRSCKGCGLDFVARAKEWRCPECSAPASSLEDRRDEVARLAGEGWPDSMIARHLGFSRTYVRDRRRQWGIPSGRVARNTRNALADVLKPCGTPGAAARHRGRGEPVCAECLAAEARRAADARARQREAASA